MIWRSRCEYICTLRSPRPHCRGRAVGCPRRICRICRFCRFFFAGLRIYPYLWIAMASCQGRLIPEFPVCGIQMELTSAKIRAPFFLCIEDKIYIVTKNYKWTHLKKCHLPLFTPYRSIFEAQVFQNTTISSGLNLKKSVGSASFELSQPQVTKISQSMLVFQVIFFRITKKLFWIVCLKVKSKLFSCCSPQRTFQAIKNSF